MLAFNPASNPWWKLLDGAGDPWRVADDRTAWNGTLSKMTNPDDCTFERTGAGDKTFWITLSKNGDNWDYNSGNWDDNASEWFPYDHVELRGSFNNWGSAGVPLTILNKYSDYYSNYS